MKMGKYYMPTLREVPSEAEIASHKLLLRAGMMRKLVSGVYSHLPLGYRVIRKIEQVVREEMDRAGAYEVLMSAVQPREIWEESGRWADFGPEMFKLKDRNERDFCLGPTHEEYFTTMVKDEVKSYKQLPLNLYQIQTKYRDEKRPRFGLIRGREFIMKDAYTFDADVEGMKVAYQKMWDAYDEVFTRLKLKYKVVGGDTGAMGGKVAHEFIALSEVGEGLIAYCDKCDYASTDEAAAVVYEGGHCDEPELAMEKVHTPDCKTIADVATFLGATPDRAAKAVVLSVKGEVVIVLIPGDRELNMNKLLKHIGAQDFDCEMASEEQIRRVTGGAPGYTGPVGLKESVRVVVDSRVAKGRNWIVGGNETDMHIKNVNYGRDFEGEVVEDLLMVREGDRCPHCGHETLLDRGIEVGNIFQLGTKYSESLGATFLDENGKEKPFIMGSYGIGVSRTMAAIVEQYHDEEGIIWPLVVAPYHVMITVVNVKDEEQTALGEKLHDELSKRGIEVLLDDRNERAGVKFKDRDLIGIPIRITVGKRAGEEIVEFSFRDSAEKEEISISEIERRIFERFANENFEL